MDCRHDFLGAGRAAHHRDGPRATDGGFGEPTSRTAWQCSSRRTQIKEPTAIHPSLPFCDKEEEDDAQCCKIPGPPRPPPPPLSLSLSLGFSVSRSFSRCNISSIGPVSMTFFAYQPPVPQAWPSMHAYRRSSERSNWRSVVSRSSSSKFQMCSLSLSLSLSLSSGCFFFCKLGCKTSWSFVDSHSNSNISSLPFGWWCSDL